MAVMMEWGKWTDERLDEFAKRIDERFDHVDQRFSQVEGRLDRVEDQLESIRSLMWHGFIALVGFQVTSTAAIIALIAVRT